MCSRRGFHTASVEEVAAAADFSKGAVYSNFTSKTAAIFLWGGLIVEQANGAVCRVGDKHAVGGCIDTKRYRGSSYVDRPCHYACPRI